MIGTSFSVTPAMRWIPPRNTTAASTATTMPTAHDGTPKAAAQVSPMELDCTMHPMKPSAKISATAKKPAKNVPNLPGKARLI